MEVSARRRLETKVETAGQKVLMDVDKFVGGVKTRGAKNEMVDKLLKAAEAEPEVKTAIKNVAEKVKWDEQEAAGFGGL